MQIDGWAARPEAKGLLAVLVRRLISATSALTELAIRGADSANLPGWDGTINATSGNEWVPAGRSRWEWGCTGDVAAKARGDYAKRTAETPADVAAEWHFVFVTPRRWRDKDRWRASADAEGHWLSVRVVDADDLEAWLEAAPSVALWFGEILGIDGPGIESIGAYWNFWRCQTRNPLTVEALSAGREATASAFCDALSNKPGVIVLDADSTEEAAAFACAKLLELGQGDSAACITRIEGWRYVDANPQLRILVASGPEVASHRAVAEGTILIVPVSNGDRSPCIPQPPAVARETFRVRLDRPDSDSFEKALIGLGEEESDAVRLTRSTGRSWSVYRRLRAANPAISKPAWLRDPAVRCLTAVVLVGGWDGHKAGDVACLEAVTGKQYEDLERELSHIACLDDSPVLRIGSVWKAKAPLELLHLFAPMFTSDELRRFFAVTQAILTKSDPALELEADRRWMASIYGKVRKESGIVIASVTDSLAKLSVYAENNRDVRLASAVDELVKNLLHDADGGRWLSLSGVLRELAEASPEVFLTAVESSLQRGDAPVRKLFSESSGDSVFGHWWHTHLLWGLETIAWSPKYLSRVSEILAKFVSSPLPENLSNRPLNSLESLFRSWWPQTGASHQHRLDALDRLIRLHPKIGWDLLVALVPSSRGFASANASPHWRDDDAGAQGRSDSEGFGRYMSEIGARLVRMAQGESRRIAGLVRLLDRFGDPYHDAIISLVETAACFPDDDREHVRGALRKYLSWHYSYGKGGEQASEVLARLRSLFDSLQPTDLATRHAWLFGDAWVELPDGREDDFAKAAEMRERWRAAAYEEIFIADGWNGIDKLIGRAGAPSLVGTQMARSTLSEAGLSAWLLKRFAGSGNSFHDPVIAGCLYALPEDRRAAVLAEVCSKLEPTDVAAFSSAAPCVRTTWDFLEQQSTDAQDIYWRKVRPGGHFNDGGETEYVLDRLTKAGRQRTAFQTIQFRAKEVDPRTLLALLDSISAGAEPDGPLPQSWRIGEAIEVIKASGVASRREIALLEFRYFPALEHGEKGAETLYSEMLEDPALFIECICLVHKRHNQPDPDESANDALRDAVSLGWRVLHQGRGVPGQLEGGKFDREKFEGWINGVRELAVAKDRRELTDITVGQWLSACPKESDGTWPCLPVRELLEREDAEQIREGFIVGVRNNRGVHSRSLGEGGTQERELAATYRGFAAPLMCSYPRTSAVLESIASSYEADGLDEDRRAMLRLEGGY